eukprot:GHRR01014039.1.p1 GENE.GHRR01014039.1~~GHRR01014039.1.p1  ORF type:complete len:452 (+),score=134.02 GHRR01014039.1:87-1358(+)
MAEYTEVQLFAGRAKKRRKLSSNGVAGSKQSSHVAADATAEAEYELPGRARNPASTSANAGPDPSTASFRELGVSDWLCSVLESLGIRRPTQVQVGCIPAILKGEDVIGTAQTGSGKTAAFALPILQQLAKDPYGIYALVLTPTRELAMQLADQFRAFGAGMSFKDAVILGGLDMQQQAQALARRPHVVVATPGRLAALIQADNSLGEGFSRLRFLVMDEADRLLEQSFEADLRYLLALLPQQDRQTLLFSATLTSSLSKLQQATLEDAYVFQAYQGLKTADKLSEQYVFVPHKVRDVYLHDLLKTILASPQHHEQLQQQQQGGSVRRVCSAIIFVSTCRGCHTLSLVLRELGIPAAALHSGKSQKQRLAALQMFKSERVPLLLATDVASRGLDIPTVDLVINYDLPSLAADYVHRCVRAGSH